MPGGPVGHLHKPVHDPASASASAAMAASIAEACLPSRSRCFIPAATRTSSSAKWSRSNWFLAGRPASQRAWVRLGQGPSELLEQLGGAAVGQRTRPVRWADIPGPGHHQAFA